MKEIILRKIIEWFVGGSLLNFVQELVLQVNDTSKTSAEKRAWVQARAIQMFSGVSMILVNLAIEVAVLLLKSQLEKENGSSK